MPDPKLRVIAELDDRASRGLSGLANKTQLGLAGIAAGAAAMGAASVKAATDLDKSIREVATLTGGAGKDIDRLRGKVLDLSASMGTDAVESTQALYQAISAGVPEENAFTFLQVASKAAIGGVTNTATAVDGITTVINAWGLETSDAEAVADSFFTTVKGGKTTFEQLSRRMSNVAPIAAAAGVSFQEVNAALEAMTKQGIPTAEATTQLRQIMAELQKPSTELQAALDGIGISSGKAALETHGLSGVLNMMADHGAKTGQSLNQMFGSVEAGAGALSLAGKQSQLFTDAITNQRNAAGAASAAYETMADGAAHSFARLEASAKKVMVEFGTKMLPVAQKVVDFFLQSEIPAVQDLEQAYTDLHKEIGNRSGIDDAARQEEIEHLKMIEEMHLRIKAAEERGQVDGITGGLESFLGVVKSGFDTLDTFYQKQVLIHGLWAREGAALAYVQGEMGKGMSAREAYVQWVDIMTARTGQMESQLRTLTGALGEAQREYREGSLAASNLVSEKQQLSESARLLGTTEATLQQIMDLTGQKLSDLSGRRLPNAIAALNQAGQSSNTTTAELNDLSDSFAVSGGTASDLTKEVSLAKDELAKLASSGTISADAIEELGKEAGLSADDLKDLKDQAADAHRELAIVLHTLQGLYSMDPGESADEPYEQFKGPPAYVQASINKVTHMVEESNRKQAAAAQSRAAAVSSASLSASAARAAEADEAQLTGDILVETTTTTTQSVMDKQRELWAAADEKAQRIGDQEQQLTATIRDQTGQALAAYDEFVVGVDTATGSLTTSLTELDRSFQESLDRYQQFESQVTGSKATRFHEDTVRRRERQDEDHAERIQAIQKQITAAEKEEQKERLRAQLDQLQASFNKRRRREDEDLQIRATRLKEDEARRLQEMKDGHEKQRTATIDAWQQTVDSLLEKLDESTGTLDEYVAEQHEKLGVLVSDHVNKPLDDAKSTVDDLKAKLQNALGLLAEVREKAERLPVPVTSGSAGSGQPQQYARGGTVPGPTGQPHLAIVHGGEVITPPGRPAPRGGDTYIVNQYIAGNIHSEQSIIQLAWNGMKKRSLSGHTMGVS